MNRTPSHAVLAILGGMFGALWPASVLASGRPSTNTESADLARYEGLRAAVEVSNTDQVLMGVVIALIVICSTLGALRLARIRKPDGSFIRARTLSSRIVVMNGVVMCLLGIAGYIMASSHADHLRVVKNADRFRAKSELMRVFDRYALEARIHARGFLLFERDEDVQRFLNAYVPARQVLDLAKDVVAEGQLGESKMDFDQLSAALGSYGSIINSAVELSDKKNQILTESIQPLHREILVMFDEVSGRTTGGDLAEARREYFEAQDAIYALLRSGSKPPDSGPAVGSLGASIRHINAWRESGKSPEAQTAGEKLVRLLQSEKAAVEELTGVLSKRFTLIFDDCPTAGHRLGEMAGQIANDAQRHYEKAGSKNLGGMLLLKITIVTAFVFATLCTILIARGIQRSMRQLIAVTGKVCSGDLSAWPVKVKAADEFGLLGEQVNAMTVSLRGTIESVAAATKVVGTGTQEFSAAAAELQDSVKKCEQQTMQVSAAVEEMSQSVTEVARQAEDATKAATRSGEHASAGGTAVETTIVEMQAIAVQVDSSAKSISELGKKSEQIGQIIGVINDIADQTNLLALNAAIEAARAGEHGRGFAVVADEVRKLAERTTKATEEVEASIREIQTQTGSAVAAIQASTGRVTQGVGLANGAGKALKQIVTGSDELRSMVGTIATAANQQALASGEVSQAMSTIAGLSQQLSGTTDHAVGISQTFVRQVEQLDKTLARFRF